MYVPDAATWAHVQRPGKHVIRLEIKARTRRNPEPRMQAAMSPFTRKIVVRTLNLKNVKALWVQIPGPDGIVPVPLTPLYPSLEVRTMEQSLAGPWIW